jgi:Amino acid synthesis
MTRIRKIVTTREIITEEMGQTLHQPISRVAGAAIVLNPLAGRYADDLSELFQIGRDIGSRLADELRNALPNPVVSYGKAALVGVNGEMEHGGACIHPMLGRPMRAAIGGGKALIPSNVKVAAAGASIDLPLGHKDEAWSFDHFDTMSLSIADAPRPDEIVIILAYADGGRPLPRCGTEPQ